jgi:A/G-specific adenine glycosylase
VTHATKYPNKARARQSTLLTRWWRVHDRGFPWRDTRDPFRILIAEVLLHRTQANQVAKIYPSFVERFPTARAIVENPDGVRDLIRPLGLRWRTRLLLEMASDIERKFNGRAPLALEQLRSLPGVSDYIAGAVRCFSRDTPEVLLDTNIVRVLGRVEGLPYPDQARRSRLYRELVRSWLEVSDPRVLYFGLIDLGAIVCTPKTPRCPECPMRFECQFALLRKTRAD